MRCGYFELYNNFYYQQGDYHLKVVDKTIGEMVNFPAYLVTCYGEEKFATFLLNTHNNEEKHVAKLIHRQINAVIIYHNFSLINDHDTINSGVATTIPS